MVNDGHVTDTKIENSHHTPHGRLRRQKWPLAHTRYLALTLSKPRKMGWFLGHHERLLGPEVPF